MKKIKKLSDSKIFWMVVSFLVSLSVWVYVTSVETVESTKTFRNVQVELVGEETLRDLRNLVITDLNAPTVTVEISGPRRIVNSLESEDLIAQVDVSKLTQTAYTPMNYTIVFPNGVDRRNLRIVTKSPDSVMFWVSKMMTQTVPVQGGFEGKAVSGYIQETPYFEPSTITIKGPEVYLRDVHHAYVSFGKEKVLDSTYSIETGYTLMDANNEPCSSDYITCTPEVIRATLPVAAVKEVPIILNCKYGAGATQGNTIITLEPSTVKLAGDSAVLDEINSIQLQDTLDLSTFATTYTTSYPIPVPNGIRKLTKESDVQVTVQIYDLETKKLDIEKFVWTGLPADVDVVVESEKVTVLLRGPASLLRRVTPYYVRAEADLSSYAENLESSLMVPIKVTVPSIPGVGAIQDDGQPEYAVIIHLVKKETSP